MNAWSTKVRTNNYLHFISNIVCLLLFSILILGIDVGVYARYTAGKDNYLMQWMAKYFERQHQPKEESLSHTIGNWLHNRNIPDMNSQGISVDPDERLIFWIEAGPPHRIWRSKLENKEEKLVIVPEMIILPIWLAADYSKKRLYFADSSSQLVQSVDYNGKDREVQMSPEICNLFTTRPIIKNENLETSTTKSPAIALSTATVTGSQTRERIGSGGTVGITCSDIFAHGAVETDCSLQPGSYCTFTCDVGYEPVSFLTIWCLATGNWSHTVDALCKEVTCPEPRPPISTVIESCAAPHTPGSECVFSCPIEWNMIAGDEVIICNEHGDWSDAPLVCDTDESSYSYSYSSSLLAVEPLEFLAKPYDSLLNYGDQLTINCVTNDESADIQWMKDGEPLTSDSVSGVFILSDGTLYIPEIEEHHAGTYTCKAHRVSSGDIITAEGHYSFPQDQVFETAPENAAIVEGDDHVIECVLRDPTLLVTWEKDGESLQYTEAIHKVPQSVNLLIREAWLTDSGRYTCVAMTFDGNVVSRASAELSVFPRQDVKEVCGTITAPAAIVAQALDNIETQKGRIVNGTLSVRGSAPWLARLWNQRTRKHFCGASIINRAWVVTAAHCITNSEILKEELIIRVGDFDTYAREDGEQLLTVSDIIVYENYDGGLYDGDIALIKLAEHIDVFNDYVRPICVPNVTTGEEMITTGVKGQVVGWGRVSEGGHFSQFMKEVKLQVRDDKKCEESTDFVVTRNMFCAGSPKREGDACDGDSGGSFAVESDGRWYLGGIVSWGEGCAREGKYGFYTRVPLFYEWIRNTIANNQK